MASIALYVTPERLSVPKIEHFHALEGKKKAISVVASTNKGGIWKSLKWFLESQTQYSGV